MYVRVGVRTVYVDEEFIEDGVSKTKKKRIRQQVVGKTSPHLCIAIVDEKLPILHNTSYICSGRQPVDAKLADTNNRKTC